MPLKRLPLAAVGIACRMPGGVRTLDQRWQLISAGMDAVHEVPSDRWDWRHYDSADRAPVFPPSARARVSNAPGIEPRVADEH